LVGLGSDEGAKLHRDFVSCRWAPASRLPHLPLPDAPRSRPARDGGGSVALGQYVLEKPHEPQ
ncbi:MAG: hypothetical protein KJN92_05785, partial [Gemmatimonadetes bacterium]|nr:hypothetical protein [Gemmatimonadota bacterium]